MYNKYKYATSYREERKLIGGECWAEYLRDQRYWNEELKRLLESDNIAELKELIQEGVEYEYQLYASLNGVRSNEADTLVREYPHPHQ